MVNFGGVLYYCRVKMIELFGLDPVEIKDAVEEW